MIKKCVRRWGVIEAVQIVDGIDQEKLQRFVRPYRLTEPRGECLMRFLLRGRNEEIRGRVQRGDWLVKSSEGSIHCYTDRDFRNTYMIVKDEKEETRDTNGKRILDPCCGSKMFWFDKNNPDVEFCDIRKLERMEYYPGRFIEINPDTVCDFTELPFVGNIFYLVVFDPPHLKQVGKNSILATKYGRLEGDWRDTLKRGFDECMRVLKPNGILVFKWSEVQITLKEVLRAIGAQPLFGNKQPKQSGTHWLCFMKEKDERKERWQK